MYLSETCSDTQFGFISTLHYSNGALISVTVEFLSAWLQPQGLFALFGCLSLVILVILFAFFKETAGLTDKEKKELYVAKTTQSSPQEVEMAKITNKRVD